MSGGFLFSVVNVIISLFKVMSIQNITFKDNILFDFECLTYYHIYIRNERRITDMLRYRFNVADALERAGMNMYQAKKSGVLSQNTLNKIKNEDTSIQLDSLNKICMILDMQPKDIIEYVHDEKEKEDTLKNFKK